MAELRKLVPDCRYPVTVSALESTEPENSLIFAVHSFNFSITCANLLLLSKGGTLPSPFQILSQRSLKKPLIEFVKLEKKVDIRSPKFVMNWPIFVGISLIVFHIF